MFLKHRWVPPQCFSVTWDNKFRRKVVILSRVLSIKFSDTRKFLKHWSVPRQKSFVSVRHNNFDGISWQAPLHLLSLNFSASVNFLKHRSVPLPNLSVLCDKTISTYTSHLLIHKIISYHTVSETQMDSPTMFSVPWDNNFPTKSSDSLALLSTIFSKNRLFQDIEGFSYKIFQYSETLNVRQKVVILSRVLSIIFSDTKKIQKHWRFALRKVSVQWVKTISTQTHDTLPPISSVKSSDTRNFLILRMAPLRSFLVLWDKTISTENHDTPHIYP